MIKHHNRSTTRVYRFQTRNANHEEILLIKQGNAVVNVTEDVCTCSAS